MAVLAGIAQGVADRGLSLRAMIAQQTPDAKQGKLPSLNPLLSAALRWPRPAIVRWTTASWQSKSSAPLDHSAGEVLRSLIEPRHAQPLQSAAAALGRRRCQHGTNHVRLLARSDDHHAQCAGQPRLCVRPPARPRAGRRGRAGANPAARTRRRPRDGLRTIRDPQLAPRIAKLFPVDAAASNRQQVVARFEPALAEAGDRQRGAAVFQRQCLTCHMLQGRGQRVGPDLSGIGARPKETLLIDVLDPSRQVAPDYMAYTLLTRQGQVLTGVIASETATSVTLRRAEGRKTSCCERRSRNCAHTGKSLMPEGLELNVDSQGVADLLAFLAQPDAGLFSRPN